MPRTARLRDGEGSANIEGSSRVGTNLSTPTTGQVLHVVADGGMPHRVGHFHEATRPRPARARRLEPVLPCASRQWTESIVLMAPATRANGDQHISVTPLRRRERWPGRRRTGDLVDLSHADQAWPVRASRMASSADPVSAARWARRRADHPPRCDRNPTRRTGKLIHQVDVRGEYAGGRVVLVRLSGTSRRRPGAGLGECAVLPMLKATPRTSTARFLHLEHTLDRVASSAGRGRTAPSRWMPVATLVPGAGRAKGLRPPRRGGADTHLRATGTQGSPRSDRCPAKPRPVAVAQAGEFGDDPGRRSSGSTKVAQVADVFLHQAEDRLAPMSN